MIVYLSGKITGDENYYDKFTNWELDMFQKGHIVLNPAVLPEGMKYGDYMRICKTMIEVADAIVLLPDAFQSKGAQHELEYAMMLDKEVMNFTDCEVALYDNVERHENCTVEILENSVTGKISVGWWENNK